MTQNINVAEIDSILIPCLFAPIILRMYSNQIESVAKYDWTSHRGIFSPNIFFCNCCNKLVYLSSHSITLDSAWTYSQPWRNIIPEYGQVNYRWAGTYRNEVTCWISKENQWPLNGSLEILYSLVIDSHIGN